jgi:hypothetical protein
VRIALVLFVVACDKHDVDKAPLDLTLPGTHETLWCERSDDLYACSLAPCSGSDCVEVRRPHWACAQTFSKDKHELQTDNCWPAMEMCELPKNTDPALVREDCRRVPKAYCHDVGGMQLCHPVPALCERMARLFAGHGASSTPAECVER